MGLICWVSAPAGSGGNQRNADVVDHVVAGGGNEEELVVRGEGSSQGSSDAGRASPEREITHGACTRQIVWQRDAGSGAGSGRSVGDECQAGCRRRHYLIDNGSIHRILSVAHRQLVQRGIKHERRKCIAENQRIIAVAYRGQAIECGNCDADVG